MKKLILIAIFLLFANTAIAGEIFILYQKSTGYLAGAGRIDREWDSKNRDGSTISEFIEQKLSEGFAVVYLPNQKLPNAKKHKIVDGKIVEMTQKDLIAIDVAKPKSEIEMLKERVKVLEAKL